MTSQQLADRDLRRWQDLRARGLTPTERIEMAFFDMLLPPPVSETELDITLRLVSEAMA